MLQALVSTATQFLTDVNQSLFRTRGSVPATVFAAPATLPKYRPLRRLRMTDGVGRTLFEEYAAHRAEARGEEETGWVLLGLREEEEAVVLATLPAGADRDASVAHIQFNSDAQALGSRIVRQTDRRLTILGIVHTHPGSLRHPSDADFRGDSEWVKHLRGNEGIFGIGTVDAVSPSDSLCAHQPKPHVQCLGPLRMTWYSLRFGATHYRPLPVELTIGPDLARPLHPLWSTIEIHAERLDRLARQQAGLTFAVDTEDGKPALAATIPLAEPGDAVRVLLRGREVRYFLARDGQVFAAQQDEPRVDRGVYLLLADLAARNS
jgi:proteasome lid subunit RPN8/RPN11